MTLDPTHHTPNSSPSTSLSKPSTTTSFFLSQVVPVLWFFTGIYFMVIDNGHGIRIQISLFTSLTMI